MAAERTEVSPHLITSSVQSERAGNILPFERKNVFDEIIMKSQKIESRLLENAYGHDVRITVAVAEDGTTIFDHQPSQEEQYDTMLKRVERGERTFDGYPYVVDVLSTTLLDAERDFQGNESWYAMIYSLGRHYENGAGEQIPKEKTWNKKREDETKSFVEISTNIWNPGIVSARLIPYGTGDYHSAEEYNRRLEKQGERSERVMKIEKVIWEYRNPPQEQIAAD